MKRITGNSKNDIVKISGCNGQKISAKGASCNYFNDANPVDFFLVEPKKEEELIIVKLSGAISFRLVFITGASQTNKCTFAWTDPETNPFIAKKNRLYSFDDRTGNLKIYIDNNVYTNDPKLLSEKEKVFFVADVGILLKYILDHINKTAVIAAAEKTAQDVSEAEKMVAKIAELEEAIEHYNKVLNAMRGLFEGTKCPGIFQDLVQSVPKNVKDDFLAIEKTYSILFADRTLLRTELEELQESNERVTADLASLIGPTSTLRKAHELPFFGLRWPGSKRSQIATSIKKILSAFNKPRG